jgi:hypothetical protein
MKEILQMTESHLKNLKYFSSQDLDLRLRKLVATERKITHLILQIINEIDLRKFYLEQGYPSLFEYLVQLGYSPASAMRRIDAARLMRQVPEVAQKIEAGEINLSQVSHLQKTIREVEKATCNQVSTEDKKKILDKISNTNARQTEVIVAREFNLKIPQVEVKMQSHQDESQSITLHLSKEEMEILNQARDLVSNSTQSSSLKAAIVYLAKKAIQKRADYKMRSKMSDLGDSKADFGANKTEFHTSVSEVELELSAEQSRRLLLKPGASCEYVDPQTQQKCGCTRFLNVDHIQPVWAGGKNHLQNYKILCSAHNKYRYQVQAGFVRTS